MEGKTMEGRQIPIFKMDSKSRALPELEEYPKNEPTKTKAEKQREQLFKTIDGVKCGRYDLSFSDMMSIKERRDGRLLDCICDTYSYGFLKGQRAEKARQKRRNG